MAYKYLDESPEKPGPVTKPILFLVEGQDDGIFLEHVFEKRCEDSQRIQIRYIKGISNLWSYFAAIIKSPDFVDEKISHICIVIDADTNFSSTEATAKRHFENAKLIPPSSGKFTENSNVRLGLYILPNSADSGELEDLLIETLSGDERIKDARDLFGKYNSLDSSYKKQSKRIIQISLALSKTDLCAGVGRGIRNGAFEVELDKIPDINSFITKFLQ